MIVSVYFVLFVVAVAAAIMFKMFSNISGNPTVIFFLIAFIFGVLFFVVHHISKFFEYDSDGMKVIVTNKGLLLSERLNYREHVVEFSKEDLVGFKFHNYVVYKVLVLLIKNSNGGTKKERFNVTLVSKKKQRYIRQSLSKMIKNNRKLKSS